VIFRAAAALSSDDPGAATAGLRGQLSTMALASGAIPDWVTLSVQGPIRVREPRGHEWFEWSATVTVEGGLELSDEHLDAAVPLRWPSRAVEETAPQQAWRDAA
jgi:hypothetical protein